MVDKEELEKIDISDAEGDFEALLDESFKQYEAGSDQQLTGEIVAISDTTVTVDLKMGQDKQMEIAEIQDENGNLLFKVGDTIPVVLSNRAGRRGKISHKQALKKQKIADFIAAHKDSYLDNQLDIEVTIISKNRGGYVAEADSVEFFLPASLAAFRADMKPIGTKVVARVVKIDEAGGSIVLSRQAYRNSQKKARRESIKKIAEIAESDQILEAVVNRIKSFGIFVEVDGVEGLVHYTEIQHKGPVNPATLYKVGDKVPVKIISIDKEKNKVSFSIKATQHNPWSEIADQLDIGDVIKVTVANMENYGAFVDLGNDTEGFLHISEISWDKDLKHPNEVLKTGQEIEVEVIDLEPEKQRLRVSLKKLLPKPFDKFAQKYRVGSSVKGTVTSIKEFGAFVKIDDVEGLLHNEDCSWDRNESAKDLFKVGDEIEVQVLKIDQEASRLSLSRKALTESPIDAYCKNKQNGDIVKGKIRDIKDFGIFVTIGDGVDALIRTEDVPPLNIEELKIGDDIEAAIVAMEPKKGRIRLSVRRLERQKERDMLKRVNTDERMTLGDALGDAIKGSFK